MTDQIAQAESEIAGVLARLELATQSLVGSVDLVRYDATTVEADRSVHVVRVRIELVRVPGHEWDQAAP